MVYSIDDNIAKIVLDNTNIFENVHPNVITLIGMVCNLILLYLASINAINAVNLFILIFVYVMCDILDGAIARKYKKTSKLGNYLDTLSDFLFYTFVVYFLVKIFDLPQYIVLIAMILMIIFYIKYDVFNTHDHIKVYNGDGIQNTVAIVTNNLIVMALICYIVLVALINTKGFIISNI